MKWEQVPENLQTGAGIVAVARATLSAAAASKAEAE